MSRGREYCGLPLTLASEDPDTVNMYHMDGSRGDYDVGRLGLTVNIVDSDPYFCGVVYQFGVPLAVVGCLAGHTGLVKGLQEEDIDTLVSVFGITLSPKK